MEKGGNVKLIFDYDFLMFEAAQELIGEDDFKTLIKEHFTKEDLFGEE